MKKLLVIVDFQNDFVSGSLGFEDAKDLDEFIFNKINEYRKNNDQIVFTFDTHDENYLNTLEGKNLPVKHCIKGTEGWELYGKVSSALKKEDLIFNKNTFGSAEFFDYIRNKKYESIEFVGLVSNICVITNAVLAKTALPETRIIVDKNGTSSFDKSLNEKTFDVLKGLQIEVI